MALLWQLNLSAPGFADLRVAVVSPFVDRRHGTERAIAELLERLTNKYCCEIHLYSQRVEDLALNNSNTKRTENSGSIIWRKVPYVPGPHIVQFIAWMFLNGILRRWDTFVGGNSFDLVLSPGINCLHPDVVVVHALFHRLKELAREQNADASAHVSFFRRVHRRVYYGLLTALERRIYTNSKVALAAVSKRTGGLLRDYFQREDVSVIPNGVDAKHFSLPARLARRAEARQRRGFRDEEIVLLLIGNDWRNKGLLTILEAMKALSASPLRLLVVGNDSTEPFRARALHLGVLGRCRWELSSPDVLDFYSAADAYVSPSREDSFGLPVAEAMACGLPVITSVFAGVSDYIDDGVDGYVLRKPSDAQALAKLLQELHANVDMRKRTGECAAKTALDWTWAQNAAAFWRLLEDSAAKKRLASTVPSELQ